MAHNDDTAKGTVTIQVQVPLQRMRDILTTAYEQGIGYWVNDGDFKSCDALRDAKGFVKEIRIEKHVSKVPTFRGEVRNGSPEKAALTDSGLACAIGRAINDKDAKTSALRELAEHDFDASTADALVQYAIFGEVIYG